MAGNDFRRFLHQELQSRMAERAELLRLPAGPIVQQGWMDAATAVCLAKRYPGRIIHEVSAEALVRGRKKPSWWSYGAARRVRSVATDKNRIDLPDDTASLVWSALWLQDVPHRMSLFQEWQRLLKTGGALFFCCFGPDTAKDLRAVGAVAGYPDMHDIGDELVRAGFADPVMEMERLTIEYADPLRLLDDWRQFDPTLALSVSPAIDRLTLELLYGHAWKAAPVAGLGESRIRVEDIGGRKARP
jgi:malonyl-CoA O-methyltransferase